MTRDERGRFVKGETGNPKGRAPREREVRFHEITLETVSYDDWRAICMKAVDQAKRGDPTARKFLADILIPPTQRHEVSGEATIIRINWDGTDVDDTNRDLRESAPGAEDHP